MKKRNLLFIMIVGILFLTGCNKTTKCTMEIKQDEYTVTSEYKITYDGNKNVVKVETEEVVTSDDSAILDTFEDSINSQLATYSDLKHYQYSISKKDNKLIEKISINYKKMDIDKFLSINPSASSMFENGKIKYDNIISIYKTLGATCEE